jgi:acetyl/propionyl-CoA carboxylase alpha subunit
VKLLVFTRGEIAARACASARALGVPNVLFVSSAELDAPAVAYADALHVVDAEDRAGTFLSLDALNDAIAATSATHVYAGYGFLSESASLARAVTDAGARFVGPSADVLAALADKARARDFAESAGLSHLGLPLDAPPVDAYPLVLKATAGGGGRGNLVVASKDALEDAKVTLAARARALFGDGTLIAERYLSGVRHVEVQFFGFTGLGVRLLGTRDCSLQRRHQKVIEEGPASREACAALAPYEAGIVRALTTLGYRGAGTLELLFSPSDGRLYFLEVNPRIQVEHPVTEQLYGIDLVTWQLREALGLETRALFDDPLESRGHVFEARIYAEDAENGFVPDTGTAHLVSLPRLPFVRFDVGLEQGAVVSPHFDPMIAKLIVWGRTRDEARKRTCDALAATHVHGVRTNLAFLEALLRDEAVVADTHDTSFIDARFVVKARADVSLPASLTHEAAPATTATSNVNVWKQAHRR